MAEKTEKQTEMISCQALEKRPAHENSGIRVQRDDLEALPEGGGIDKRRNTCTARK